MAAFERLSEHLYRYEDTCAVYVVINPDEPDRATLVDFGAGSILAQLGEIGVREVDWILHTHHHRDQCQGDWRAAERGLPIAVPSHERHLFDDVENFWQNRRIFHLYYVRNTYFTLTESVPVAAELTDYERFSASGYEFFVLPTPGHTLGSVTLLAEIDGRKVAFSGDLIHSPGKVATFHDLQYQYGATDGVDFALVSLHHLRNQGPQLAVSLARRGDGGPGGGLGGAPGKAAWMAGLLQLRPGPARRSTSSSWRSRPTSSNVPPRRASSTPSSRIAVRRCSWTTAAPAATTSASSMPATAAATGCASSSTA